MKTPSSWPVLVKQGNVTVKIYHLERGKYQEFKVAFYGPDGKRRFKTFADYDKALRHANTVAASFAKGDAQAVTLTGSDAAIYLRAKQSTDSVGITLDAAAADYAASRNKLGDRSLVEAVEFFVRNVASLKSATVEEVVKELVESRRNPIAGRRPRSDKYLKDLEGRLMKFAGSFRMRIASISSDHIRQYLQALDGVPQTKWNHLRLLRTLFLYAKANRYYPRDLDPFEPIRDAFQFDDDSEIEIFTPEEITRLLGKCRPELLPMVAIGAFAGLRSAEIERLDWSDIRADHIQVTKGKAKTRSRRVVPISPNLAQWLEPFRRESGPVVPFASVAKQLLALAASTGEPARDGKEAVKPVRWKHNGLRHSFISYRMAVTQNENLVASEAGNSPQMIHAHYRQLVTEQDGRNWFKISPNPAENILAISSVGA